ncbi:MAG: hypothetical protein M1819_006453 [Sarea resinae]|nr:MAG: hypothetical protein M1819_006453 [Sarea resinae]
MADTPGPRAKVSKDGHPSEIRPGPRDDAQAAIKEEEEGMSNEPNEDILNDGDDEASRLKHLTENVRDQDDLERDIGRQADRLLLEQADERDQKRLEKTKFEKERLFFQIRKLEQRLAQPNGSATRTRLQAEKAHLDAKIATLDTDLVQIQERIDDRHKQDEQIESGEEQGNKRLPNESQRDFLIRTGKITPFSAMGRSLARSGSSFHDVMLDAEEGLSEDETEQPIGNQEVMSHRNLLMPGFEEARGSADSSDPSTPLERPTKRRRVESTTRVADSSAEERASTPRIKTEAEDTFIPDLTDEDDEFLEIDEDDLAIATPARKRKTAGKRKARMEQEAQQEDLTGIDDGNEALYQMRLKDWAKRRSEARKRAIENGEAGDLVAASDQEGRNESSQPAGKEEYHLPHPTRPDAQFDGGYRIPGDIFPSLFDYQKTGVQWLWELFSQQVGGIIGDEMGLGKTIQIISFLAGLHYSNKLTKPIIVVAPATVMKQWVNEFHRWWPPFRVSILHTSGSGMIDIGRERQAEDELVLESWDSTRKRRKTKGQKAAERIVDRVVKDGHVLVTTYSGLQTYAEQLISIDWEYAVLDEGHKIRNPNAAITIYCKELRTANRVILSGTPMQNNLTELWSLFDFVFPMRLGTLVNFRAQFEFPIKQGGYANASNLQVQTAMKCAETLKDTISPYLLQRFKIDVAADLPKKTEQVLFCKLTRVQREAYENFLASDDMKSIMNGKRQVLYGIDILRKICNHPDLVDRQLLSQKVNYNYGNGTKAGKMQVVKALIELWKKTGHKTLLFAQHRIMLDILEKYIQSLVGIQYRRMDGNTPIQNRQSLVDEFNKTPDIHVFLLTTKVGGLGVNLTGADRVIIYDPDWNPSTDVQARERAWRLGQKREVMIYRLMTAGTIEEKIYHRQIFKQLLTHKILKDPKQRQNFQLKDLHDLFTLGSADAGSTETSELFQGTEVKFGNGETAKEGTTASGNGSSSAVEGDRDDPSSVRKMAGVAGLEHFVSEEEEGDKASDPAKDSEARVMEGIFARSGVHSALEHDQIINGKRVVAADPKMIEREAKRVAAEAAKELKKAGEAARSVPIGTPTWTGEFGSAGRPEARSGFGRASGRGGPASSSILAGLQSRQTAAGNASFARAGTPVGRSPRSGTPGPRGKEFMKLIRDYLLVHGGQVHTQMLIDHFNRFCNTAEQTAEFKEMLKEIADLEKGSRGRGRWVLKEEYKNR